MDPIRELAIIRLLESVERTDQSGWNQHAAAAARRRLQAVSSTLPRKNVDLGRIQQAILRRLREIDARRKWFAETQTATVPNAELTNKEQK